jgi:signal transduction histidine kinase
MLQPRRVFLAAVGLIVGGGALASVTMFQLFSSERLVRHTYQVQLKIAEIETDLAKAGRTRAAYLDSGDERFLKDFEETQKGVARNLEELHSLTMDNGQQQANCYRLDAIANGWLEVLRRSIQLRQSGPLSPDTLAKFTSELVNRAFETAAITGAMQENEKTLLEKRRMITSTLFVGILVVLFVAFCIAIYLFGVYYRLLATELREREAAERSAQSLSTALMRVQDEERRKFSLELHDSLGQLLAGCKMIASRMARKFPEEPQLPELETALSDAVNETRTISHLMYPPLLDEMGFISAAKWFTENYSQRTGIAVTFNGPEEIPELPKNLELAMFRVLQEALTNVHRHSRTRKAEVHVEQADHKVALRVKDYGIGIPAEKLAQFRASGTGVGVGLAGMTQRAKEQGGTLRVASDSMGTVISVVFHWGAGAGQGGETVSVHETPESSG